MTENNPLHRPPRRTLGAATSLETEDGLRAIVDGDEIVIQDRRGVPIVHVLPDGGVRICAVRGDLRLEAPEGRVLIQANRGVELTTERFVTECSEIIQRVGRWELSADRIFEVARDSYREVASLAQTRAGRMRTLVDRTYQLFTKRTSMVSDDDTSIDGNRILLG